MKIVKARYSVSTGYVGSEITEDIEIRVSEEADEDEIEEIIQRDFEEWVWNNITSGYSYESI